MTLGYLSRRPMTYGCSVLGTDEPRASDPTADHSPSALRGTPLSRFLIINGLFCHLKLPRKVC